MSKPESNGDREQLDLDNDTIKLAFTQWSDAAQVVVETEERLNDLRRERAQLERKLTEAVYNRRLKWRALRRAQGYDTD